MSMLGGAHRSDSPHGATADRTEDGQHATNEHSQRWVGKYRILSELGRGGMSNVYLAVTRGPGGVSKLVVLKALLPDLASEPAALSMFLDEARLAAQLNHANVVQTYEVGTEGDRHVIVMEYLDGQALSAIIQRSSAAGNPVSLAMYLRILINVLEGLHYAHELSGYDGAPLLLVHRDVSPQNVFVTYGGQIKILDFGIAKATSSSTHTVTGVVKGKISYMAPEQMVAESIDRRADIYSVGCILWAIAAGRKLWKDTADVQIMRRVISSEIPSPQSVNPECDDDLNRIVMRALEPDRNRRYQTALELLEDLEKYCERFGVPMRQKDIGAVVSTLFADTRAKLKALIERQLSSSEESPSLSSVSLRTELRARSSKPAGASESGIQSAVDARKPGAQPWLFALMALLVLGAYLFLRAREVVAPEVNRSPPPAAVAAEPTVTEAKPQPPAAPARIALELTASPPEARLFLDDQRLPSNPTSKLMEIDGRVHRIRAEAEGYLPSVVEFSPTHDETVGISLIKSTKKKSNGRVTPVSGRKAALPAAEAGARAAAQASTRQCAQPFYVDADGIKKPRPECI